MKHFSVIINFLLKYLNRQMLFIWFCGYFCHANFRVDFAPLSPKLRSLNEKKYSKMNESIAKGHR